MNFELLIHIKIIIFTFFRNFYLTDAKMFTFKFNITKKLNSLIEKINEIITQQKTSKNYAASFHT